MFIGLTENGKVKDLSVAFVIVAYPSLTKTFVDREITALRQMGVDIRVYSVGRKKTILSPPQEEIARNVTFLLPYHLKHLFAAHFYFLSRHPRRVFSTLFSLLTSQHPTLLSRRRTFNHFVQGVYTAYLIARDPVQHIHAHFLNQSAIIAVVASRLLNIPYSVEVHASRELYANPMLLREKLSGAKFIVTCTDYNRKYLADLDPLRIGNKVRLLYHGLDADQFRRKSASQSQKPVILSVGQLRERKGFQYLVEACQILKDNHQEFECRIVGEGPLRKDLEQQIEQRGLTNQVSLCGALTEDEIIQEYEQAHLFTLPAVLGADGDRDGIPNVILEAMAMELPVVSTLHSGIPEVVKDGVSGFLVPPKNAPALAGAMQSLLNDPGLRKKFGKSGRQFVLENFDPESNAKTLLEMFQANQA